MNYGETEIWNTKWFIEEEFREKRREVLKELRNQEQEEIEKLQEYCRQKIGHVFVARPEAMVDDEKWVACVLCGLWKSES